MSRKLSLLLAVVFATALSMPLGGATSENQSDSFFAEDISLLVKENCGQHLSALVEYEATNPEWDELMEDYAHCVFAIFHKNNVLGPIVTSCVETIRGTKIPLGMASVEGKHMLSECFTGKAFQTGIAFQLSALAEACSLYQDGSDFPAGCSLAEYCEGCPDLAIDETFYYSCTNGQSSCLPEIIHVKHNGTELIGECGGKITRYDEFPRVEPGEKQEMRFPTFSGDFHFFHWRVNTTIEPEEKLDFDFICNGEARIIGEAHGGFQRQLYFQNSELRIADSLCQYDGFIESGCRGARESDNENFGYSWRFNPDTVADDYKIMEGTGFEPKPPGTMTFEHESGVVLSNVGQGSLRAYRGLDPDPVDVPKEILNVSVVYNETDNKKTTIEAPLPNLIHLMIVVSIVVVVRQSVMKRPG